VAIKPAKERYGITHSFVRPMISGSVSKKIWKSYSEKQLKNFKQGNTSRLKNYF
jgi:hypothetical protein